jgi:dipeptidase E
LCSQTITPQIKSDFQRFVGKPTAGMRMAFITTAANPYDGDKSWIAMAAKYLELEFGFEIELLDIAGKKQAELSKVLQTKDIVWFNGGLAGYLMQQIKLSKLDKLLPKLIRRGLIYCGSSAGAMVATPSLEIAEWYIGEPEPGTSQMHGLNLVDFEIYPHYTPDLLPQIKQHKSSESKYVLLSDSSAVMVDDMQVSLCGANYVMLDPS